ncbi:MAG: hypothetical protein JXA94_04570 [Parachlamydiales bacterium]|nr:hypothetical protein [Parachlamydiales bacterium]
MIKTHATKVSSIFNDLTRQDKLLEEKKVDLKIKDLATNRIAARHFGKMSAQLINTQNAKEIFNLFSSLLGKPNHYPISHEEFNKIAYLKQTKNQNEPIGINGPNWVCALAQFMINIPSIKNMFDFTPKSFLPFNVFIDCYEYDKKNMQKSATYSCDMLLDCLIKKFPQNYFIKNKGKIDIYKILNLIMNALFEEDGFFEYENNSDLLAFHPNWQVLLDPKITQPLENILEFIFKRQNLPKELLLGYRWFFNDKKTKISKKLLPRKHIFLKNNFYELDAFIEYREDGKYSSYITYLKIDNTWYQIEDLKVKTISANNLFLPLSKSIIQHYSIIKEKMQNFR